MNIIRQFTKLYRVSLLLVVFLSNPGTALDFENDTI